MGFAWGLLGTGGLHACLEFSKILKMSVGGAPASLTQSGPRRGLVCSALEFNIIKRLLGTFASPENSCLLMYERPRFTEKTTCFTMLHPCFTHASPMIHRLSRCLLGHLWSLLGHLWGALGASWDLSSLPARCHPGGAESNLRRKLSPV